MFERYLSSAPFAFHVVTAGHTSNEIIAGYVAESFTTRSPLPFNYPIARSCHISFQVCLGSREVESVASLPELIRWLWGVICRVVDLLPKYCPTLPKLRQNVRSVAKRFDAYPSPSPADTPRARYLGSNRGRKDDFWTKLLLFDNPNA